MSGFRFEPNDDGIFEVSTGDDVGPLLDEVAQAAAAAVRRMGPKGDDFFDYESTVAAEPARRDPADRMMTAGVRVSSSGWHLPEYGTVRYPPRAPLRKGVASVVDFVEGEMTMSAHFTAALHGRG